MIESPLVAQVNASVITGIEYTERCFVKADHALPVAGSIKATAVPIYHAVKDARLAHIVRVDLKNELFAYDVDRDALALAELMDGKLLLVTNTPQLPPAQIVARYKSLADIERGFRVLKSEIEIGPVFHRFPERIKAHASLCFIALTLYRIMRQRLYAADSCLSPERALEQLQRIQHHPRVRQFAPKNADF